MKKALLDNFRRAFAYINRAVLRGIRLFDRLCQSTWLFLFRQYTENICFFSKFSAGGLCDWGILLVISLEFQGNKASTVFYDTAFRIVPLPQGRRTFSIKKRGIKMAVL